MYYEATEGQIQECEGRAWDILDGHSKVIADSPWRDYFKAAMGLFKMQAGRAEAAEARLRTLLQQAIDDPVLNHKNGWLEQARAALAEKGADHD